MGQAAIGHGSIVYGLLTKGVDIHPGGLSVVLFG